MLVVEKLRGDGEERLVCVGCKEVATREPANRRGRVWQVDIRARLSWAACPGAWSMFTLGVFIESLESDVKL